MKVKSIYEEDLRCNAEGLHVKYEAEKFFKMLLEMFPEHNPREMTELCSSTFSIMATRRVLDLRKFSDNDK